MPVRKSTVLTMAFLTAAVVLGFALNPGPERHRASIKETVGDRSPVARVLGIGSLAAFASSYHTLGVASYTRAGERTLSVGAFGLVYVLQP